MGEIHAAAAQHGLTQWLHLTLRHDTGPRPPHYARKLLRKWRSLRDVYAKHFGTRLAFVWFKQVEHGWPHLHIFTRGLDRRWVAAEWRRRTGAYQIELEDIDPATMPTPARYATRAIHDNAAEYRRSCGRWWGASQGIRIDVRRRGRGNGEWQFAAGRIDTRRFPDDECAILRVDEAGRPTHVRVKPKEARHAS